MHGRGAAAASTALCACVCVLECLGGTHARGVRSICAPSCACVSYYVVDKREAGLEKMEKDEREKAFSACSRELLEGSAGLIFVRCVRKTHGSRRIPAPDGRAAAAAQREGRENSRQKRIRQQAGRPSALDVLTHPNP